MYTLSQCWTPLGYGLAVATAAHWLNSHMRQRADNPGGLPLPPGPKGLPFVGNLFDLPLHKPWLAYDAWIKKYGDMVYLNVLGKSFLILGSMERINDIFEKRSSNYSDRPPMPMIIDLMRWDFAMALIPYGPWHRRQRQVFHNYFSPNVLHEYRPVQISAVRALLRNILQFPGEHRGLIRLFFAFVSMKISYGLTVRDWNNEHVRNMEEALQMLFEASIPGRYLVDVFPIMKHIPSWFPGAGWKRTAEYCRELLRKVVDGPYEQVKKEMSEGKAVRSVCTELVEALPQERTLHRAEEERLAKNVLALAYAGGADTIVSACLTFLLAMCFYPDVQQTAQAELDSVLQGRLPEFSDRPSLPYINAMVKETQRWQLVTPSAFYHSSTNSDTYNGYYIPQGTLVVGNGWTILHDPQIFENPEDYIPERYLKDGQINPEVRDPDVAAFGFGNRKCPGRQFADELLFITIAHILSVYDIKPGLNKNGEVMKTMPEYGSGAVSSPGPFPCFFTPRSKAAVDLIRNSELEE